MILAVAEVVASAVGDIGCEDVAFLAVGIFNFDMPIFLIFWFLSFSLGHPLCGLVCI